MFTLTLDDENAERLQAIANQQNRSPSDVLRDLIWQYYEQQARENPTSLKPIDFGDKILLDDELK